MRIFSRTTSTFAFFGLLVGLAYSQPAAADEGHDFIQEAKLFHDIVACGTETAAQADATRTVKRHCKELRDPVRRFKKRYLGRAARFLAKRRPATLPATVVYPFGGGDLISALVTYPDATEITTVSLEHAGDPRRLKMLQDKDLEERLTLFRTTVNGLLNLHDSTSKNLRKMEKGPLPGQLSFFMLGIAAAGYEPVSMKFFKINDDGSLHYYSKREIQQLDSTLATKKERRWIDTDYSIAFSNVELTFRKVGDPNASSVVHRHIVFNLDNEHFTNSPLSRHLKAKGKIAAMTKAASYLLWLKDFSAIRDYLLDNMTFMFSDSTGIPPLYAKRKGFEQITYGTFMGSFLRASKYHNEAFLALWQEQPQRALSFRYGYTDSQDNYHMMITRPKKRWNKRRARKKATKKAMKKAPNITKKAMTPGAP